MQNQITVNGKKIKVEFNYGAIRTYERETGFSYAHIIPDITGDQPKMTAIIGLVAAGISGAGGTYEINQLANDVMKMTVDEITDICKAYADSLPKAAPKTQNSELETQNLSEPVGE